MDPKITNHTYGGVTKTFHWVTALLIFTVIPVGIIANDLPFETSEQLARKALLFSLHKTLGITIFLVSLARIIWAISQPKPGLLTPDTRIEATLAKTAHWLLYGSLVMVPLAGWATHAATTGFSPIWWPFGQSLPFVPKNEHLAALFAGLHLVLERVLVVTLLVHIAGALKHHFVDRDATLRRMLPGAHPHPQPPLQPKSVAPVLFALLIWSGALLGGFANGIFDRDTVPAPATELEEVQSQWAVQTGTIDITVTLFGSPVTGQFDEWTAAIVFDPDQQDDTAGTVEVTVSIESLALGSVTAQALGVDFFDASTYPTAVFAADIVPVPDGYIAEGTLTIRGRTLPVTLYLDLFVNDGVAEMKADLFLDRRDFAIGDNMPDEKSLGFSVKIDAELTARQNTE